MSVLAVLITGDPIASVCGSIGSFGNLVRAATDCDEVGWEEIDVRHCRRLPDPRDFAACVITGSPHSVTEQTPWMHLAEAYLRHARDLGTPLFGICFGHQLMATAFGGQVVINPKGREMGTYVATSAAAGNSLGWPEVDFSVHMSHRDTVAELPPNAHVLARTGREAHAAIYYGDGCFSTQFHPEFTPEVLACYVEHYRDALHAQGDDVDALLAAIHPCPEARALLTRFIHAAVAREQAQDQKRSSERQLPQEMAIHAGLGSS